MVSHAPAAATSSSGAKASAHARGHHLGADVPIRCNVVVAGGLNSPHIRRHHLTRTDAVSHCPYKGQAEWCSVRAGDAVHQDLAWSYATPLPESQKIAGLISFYAEKVDVSVDGVLQERPSTKFS